MFVLNTSTKLQVILSGAKATNDCPFTLSYTALTTTTDVPAIATGTTNGTTAVDVVAAPGSGAYLIKEFTVFNADTASVTLTIRTNNSGTTRTIFKATLAVGDSLVYEDRNGFIVTNSNCQIKQMSSPYKLMRPPIVLITGTLSYKVPPNCVAIEVEAVGGGGGGGGATSSAANTAAAGGGAGGGYLRVFILNPQTTSITVSISGTHSGGTGSGTNGTDGADTTIAVNSITYTAKGGKGGVGTTFGNTPLFVLGGAGQLPTNGDINIAGQPGTAGIRISGTIAFGGTGGSSALGSGGRAQSAGGNAGNSYGGGGAGGSNAGAGAQAGGTGAAGVIIIREYSI